MSEQMTNKSGIIGGDGLDRRGLLKCMAWASGGVPRSVLVGEAKAASMGGLAFVQISDTHLGFNKDANPHPDQTLSTALGQIGQLPTKPAFLVHTGDITHLSKPAEFDAA